ncbi:MAG: TIGR03086 family protein [SAR202 cluster bacterium Io17-Chloro-G4]|nr:MAG: TIGR03086 family protein [SAR202 cluster bacterium Io17-Chloro-G4]
MTQTNQNPIELYEAAIGYMLPIMAAVKDSQLNDSTPCVEWNVQQLILHNIKVAQAVHSGITGSERVDPFDVSGPIPSEGAEAAFHASTSVAVQDLKVPGNLEKIVDSPFGKIPVAQFIMLPFADMVIHKWDLARAVGAEEALDGSLAEICYNTFACIAEGARNSGAFGPEVQIPISGSMQDKLLGVTGRTP